MEKKRKVLVGLSGGVDSSVAAYLLLQEGYEVIGVTMQMESAMANKKVIEDAALVAKHLGITHIVLDFHKEFKEHVIQNFIQEYQNGRTPNPCIVCNRNVKWEALLEKADELDADYIATGHYATIRKLENQRYAISNSVTAAKDQTYALYQLTQKQLERTLMPVGAYEKDQIRKMALDALIPVATKADSQEICFIPDHDYAAYIERNSDVRLPKEGDFVNTKGEVIGRHKGLIHYTVGQRKGLNLSAGHPVFVKELKVKENQVVIGESEDLFTTVLQAYPVHYMGIEKLTEPTRFLAKIRYGHKGQWCTVTSKEDGSIECVFDEPVRAVTPGQSVVLYQDQYVALGGVIQ